jgi:hypothetical protein
VSGEKRHSSAGARPRSSWSNASGFTRAAVSPCSCVHIPRIKYCAEYHPIIALTRGAACQSCWHPTLDLYNRCFHKCL